LNHIDLANNVLIDIRNNNRQNAATKITKLLEENANLSEKWGAITRLALTIGEIKLTILSAKKYLSLGPSEPKRIIQVAGILAEADRVEEAIELVESNSELITTTIKSHFLGTAYSQTGQLDKALINLEVTLKNNPLLGISWLTLASICNFKEHENKLLQMQQLENEFRRGTDIQNHIPYWFAFGKALLDTNDDEKSLQKFNIGNQLMAKKMPFNKLAYSQYIDSIISIQNKQFFEQITPLQNSNKSPIFIIGLPRSGTTLLQQVLSAHSELPTGGEANCLTLASATIDQSNMISLSNKDSAEVKSCLEKVQNEYFHLMSEKYGNSEFYIDKTLNLNHQIGLIKLCFPNAKIIKIHRDPKDNAWSCFRTFFNQGQQWCYKVDDIALFFKHENKLFEHWKGIFNKNIFELTYEQLVSNSEETVKLLTDFLSLYFEPTMLEFYKSKSLVKTASVGQVRASFNTDSIGSSNSLPRLFDDF
jgi:tetratricopeptide (TPR) repeat protein